MTSGGDFQAHTGSLRNTPAHGLRIWTCRLQSAKEMLQTENAINRPALPRADRRGALVVLPAERQPLGNISSFSVIQTICKKRGAILH